MQKRYLTLITFLTLAVVTPLCLAPGPARAQDSTAELLARINAARLAQGLYPYVSSPQLNAAAQRHSDDMAAHGQLSHTGSDGSSETQRILEAGYGAYEFGPVVAESIHQGDNPFDAWLGQLNDRNNLLHQQYREVGLGAAGGYWTVTFGAQPNVLPVLVNNGASSVDTLTVTLTLVPENAAPNGQGTAIGQPIQYRASTDEQFSGAEWQTWQPEASFTLDEIAGSQTVYVQLQDAAGRTVISWTTIVLTSLPQPTDTPEEPDETGTPGTATTSPTMTMTATRTPKISPTMTMSVTATGTLGATVTATPTLTATPTVTATSTPSVTVTPRPTNTPRPSATGTPPPPPMFTATPTPPPTVTMTPLPSSTMTMTFTPMPPSRTPEPTLRVIPIEGEDDEEAEPAPLATRLAPLAVCLQIMALILGLYVALRRPGKEIGD